MKIQSFAAVLQHDSDMRLSFLDIKEHLLKGKRKSKVQSKHAPQQPT